MRAVALGLATVFTFACGSANPTQTRKGSGLVVIDSKPADAEVWVDGKYVSSAARLRSGVRVPAGTHRVELRHVDFHTHYELVDVKADSTTAVHVQQAKRLP